MVLCQSGEKCLSWGSPKEASIWRCLGRYSGKEGQTGNQGAWVLDCNFFYKTVYYVWYVCGKGQFLLMRLAWQSPVIASGEVLKNYRQGFGLELNSSSTLYLQVTTPMQVQTLFPGRNPNVTKSFKISLKYICDVWFSNMIIIFELLFLF